MNHGFRGANEGPARQFVEGASYIVLKGQDHSPWEYDLVQNVYKEELEKLKKYC